MILRKEPVKYKNEEGVLTIYQTILKDNYQGDKARYEVSIKSQVYQHSSGLVKAKQVPAVCSNYIQTFKTSVDNKR